MLKRATLLSVVILLAACAPASPTPATPTPYATYTAYPTYTPPPPPSPCATLAPWLADCASIPDGACRIEALTGIPYYDDEELTVLLGALTVGDRALVDETLSMDRFHIVGRGWARGSYTVFHCPPGCLLWHPDPGPTPTQEVWPSATPVDHQIYRVLTILSRRRLPSLSAERLEPPLPVGALVLANMGTLTEAEGFLWVQSVNWPTGWPSFETSPFWFATRAVGGPIYAELVSP